MARQVGYFDERPSTRGRRRRRAADARSWRSRLRAASWRGVPFYVDEAASEYGRRIEHHEYPQRDQPWAEDLGRAQRRWSVTGYVLGAGYMGTRDRLIAACEQSGPGKLIHPYLGELHVVCNQFRCRERDEEGGICRFELSFAEPGVSGAPTARRAAGAALQGAAAGLQAAAISAFAGTTFRVAGFQDFVAISAVANLVQLAAILEGLRGPTVQLPQPVSFETRRQILALAALDPAAVSATTIATVVLDAVAAFAASVSPPTALDGLDALTLVTFPEPPTIATPARAQEAENARCLTALVEQAAAAALPGPLTTIPLGVYEDLVAVRTRVVTICDRVEALATDAVFAALAAVRAEAIAQLTIRGTTLQPLRRYATAFPRPSLVLAQRLYQDPSRDQELVARTGAVHPGFLPQTGLVAAA
jgi:prophage DNA circulation protein